MFLDVARHAGRRGWHRQIVRELLPGLLHAPFDLAHVAQVLIEPRPVRCRQLALQRRGFAEDGVEQADRLRAPRLALLGGVAVAEQPLEDDLRIVLHRQRRVRTLPRNRVAVRAAQAVAAVQARLFDRQLERRQGRVLPDLLRGNLIDGDAERRLRAGFGERAAEKRGGRAVVIRRRAAAVGIGVPQIADDVDLVVERLERLQDRRELEAGALGCRRPLRHDRAVREVDRAEPRPRLRRGLAEQRRRRESSIRAAAAPS